MCHVFCLLHHSEHALYLNYTSHVPLLHLLCHWYTCSASVKHVVALLPSFVPLPSYATYAQIMKGSFKSYDQQFHQQNEQLSLTLKQ